MDCEYPINRRIGENMAQENSMGIDLPEHIDRIRSTLLKNVNSKKFYMDVLESYFEQYIKMLEKITLPDISENQNYGTQLTSEGLILWQEYHHTIGERSYDKRIKVLSTGVKYLSTEDYIEKYVLPEKYPDRPEILDKESEEHKKAVNTSVTTIRQQIRRCKIKYAKKLDDRWYFPEFVRLPQAWEKPNVSSYEWDFIIAGDELEQMSWLGEKVLNGIKSGLYNSVAIINGIYYISEELKKNLKNDEKYTVFFSSTINGWIAVYHVTKKERDSLELFLIKNPFVRYVFGAGEAWRNVTEAEK